MCEEAEDVGDGDLEGGGDSEDDYVVVMMAMMIAMMGTRKGGCIC